MKTCWFLLLTFGFNAIGAIGKTVEEKHRELYSLCVGNPVAKKAKEQHKMKEFDATEINKTCFLLEKNMKFSSRKELNDYEKFLDKMIAQAKQEPWAKK